VVIAACGGDRAECSVLSVAGDAVGIETAHCVGRVFGLRNRCRVFGLNRRRQSCLLSHQECVEGPNLRQDDAKSSAWTWKLGFNAGALEANVPANGATDPHGDPSCRLGSLAN